MEFAVFALPTYYKDRDGTQQAFMQRTIDFLVLAEELGYDSVWANEHHFHPFGGMIPSPAVMLAALSQRTKRVRLGTSVAVLPLHNPLEVAEQFAMVDLMSGGRLEFGVGRGFVAYDFEVHGVPIDEGQDRTMESLDIIIKAWSGEKFSHEGQYCKGREHWILRFPTHRLLSTSFNKACDAGDAITDVGGARGEAEANVLTRLAGVAGAEARAREDRDAGLLKQAVGEGFGVR